MTTKLAIHAGAPIEDVLLGWESNRSGRLNAVVDRYLDLIEGEQARLPFTLAEWHHLLDAMVGANVEGRDGHEWRQGWSMLFRTADPNTAPIRKALGLRLQSMSDLAQCAVWEAAAAFWAMPRPSVAAFVEELGLCKALAA